jgi:hypothetical protein
VPSTIASAGWSDAEALTELRGDLNDFPMPYTETWTGDGASAAMRCMKWPVYDANSAEYSMALTVGGVPSTLKQSRADLSAATDAYIENETGWVYFQQAPASGASVSLAHYQTIWTDRQMGYAIAAGLRKLFPMMGQEDFCSITLQTFVYEYTLTPFAVWRDPRARVIAVEVQEIPAATERFWRLQNWERIGLNVIRLPDSQYFTPGAQVRVRYWGPYTSVAELEEAVRDMVLMYAKGRLMLDKAAQAARFENPSPSEQSQQRDQQNIAVAASMIQEFQTWLAHFSRPVKIAGIQSTYGS